MDLKLIANGMVVILIGLYLFSKWYQKKTAPLKKLEVAYSEAVFAFHQAQNEQKESLKKVAIEKATAYATARKLSESQLQKIIENDLK